MPEDSAQTAETQTVEGPSPATLDGAIEALLLSTEKPVKAAALADVIAAAGGAILEEDAPKPTAEDIRVAIDRLNASYDDAGRSFRIEPVAGGYRAMTRPEYAAVLAAFHRQRSSARLSRAAIETLSVIAYRQPVTRGRIEAIRGVACGEVLKTLMERRFVTITGRAEELGRPMLYGTTKHFLDAFGLSSLKDLPPPPKGFADAAAQPPADEPAPPAERTED